MVEGAQLKGGALTGGGRGGMQLKYKTMKGKSGDLVTNHEKGEKKGGSREKQRELKSCWRV